MEVKYILGISVFALFTLFVVVWSSMGVNPLYSFEVDMLCNENDSSLKRVNGTWGCSLIVEYTLNSSELDKICSDDNSTLQRLNGTWGCSQPNFTGTCSGTLNITNGLVTGCI